LEITKKNKKMKMKNRGFDVALWARSSDLAAKSSLPFANNTSSGLQDDD
jgi:hypothetical protein